MHTRKSNKQKRKLKKTERYIIHVNYYFAYSFLSWRYYNNYIIFTVQTLDCHYYNSHSDNFFCNSNYHCIVKIAFKNYKISYECSLHQCFNNNVNYE